MRHSLLTLCVCVGMLVGAVGSVQAQQRGGGPPSKSIGLGAALHAGGEIDFDFGPGDGEDDLKGTVGLRLHWDKMVVEKRKRRARLGVSLGLLGRAVWWAPETGEDRSTLIDLAFRVRFRVAFKDFAFYMGPALGPTLISILHEDYNADERARPGVNLSFVALGFEWWWNAEHSLFVEIGYAGHWLYHDFDAQMDQALIGLGVNFGR